MSVVVYLYYMGQLKVSLFACRSIFLTFQFIKRKLAHTVLDPRQLFIVVSISFDMILTKLSSIIVVMF